MIEILERINLNKVIQPDLFALNNIEQSLLPQVVSRWHKDIFYSHVDFSLSNEKCDFLFFRSLIREDYEYLENEIASSIVNGSVLFFKNYKTNTKGLNLDIVSLVTENRKILHLIDVENTLIKIGLYLRIVWYLYVFKKIIEIDFKVFVAFADMQPTENFIIQMLHVLKPNVQTTTLQHGLYIDYSGFETVNEVNYKNHVAKHFLAWGRETKELITKYHQNSSIFVCGKPSISGLPVFADSSDASFRSLDILIVTDQKIFQEQNELLSGIVFEVAERLGVDVHIRFHPSNNKNLILNKYKNFKELKRIKKSYIVVGHTSSLLYEAHTLGYPSFRLKTNVHHIKYPDSLEFENAEELLSRILNFNRKIVFESRRYIEFVGVSSLQMYRSAFSDILSLFKG